MSGTPTGIALLTMRRGCALTRPSEGPAKDLIQCFFFSSLFKMQLQIEASSSVVLSDSPALFETSWQALHLFELIHFSVSLS